VKRFGFRRPAVYSPPDAAFLTSSNWVISTVPSGNLAVMFLVLRRGRWRNREPCSACG